MRFNKGKIIKTLRLNDCLIVDLDNKSNVLGVELLNAKSQLAPSLIKKSLKKGGVEQPVFA